MNYYGKMIQMVYYDTSASYTQPLWVLLKIKHAVEKLRQF